MRIFPALACLLFTLALAHPAASQDNGRAMYDRLLARPGVKASNERITGIVVPHHAPALGLAVTALSLANGRTINRVIILCPDHYHRSLAPFAVTDRDFETPYGLVRTDRQAAAALLADPDVGRSTLFDHEHGVNILLPLVSAFFPKAAIVPIAGKITATPAECERLAATLAKLVTPETLIILSADFSHHQTQAAARRFDQQSLCVLAQNDPKAVLALGQPENVDTVAMLYVQTLLQKRLSATFTALSNQDTTEITGRPVPEPARPVDRATSYIAGVWRPTKGPTLPLPGVAGQRIVFAGDTFFGRLLAPALANPTKRAALARHVKELTGGAPLIVNLEGVLAQKCPPPASDRQLCMEAGPALALLKELNVKWAGLANNHIQDLGPQAYDRMKTLLRQAKIDVLEKNTVTDLGALKVAAFTTLENGKTRAETAIGARELAVLDADALETASGGANAANQTRQPVATVDAANQAPTSPGRANAANETPHKPLAVFVHWGQEWVVEPEPGQLHLYDAFREKGSTLVIGAHSHRPGVFVCGAGGCLASSLGNFVFDQTRPVAGGMLVEATIFPRGTWFARPIPAGNLGGEILKNR